MGELDPRFMDIGVKGLHCGGCVARLTKILQAQPGVKKAEVSLTEGRARLEVDGASREGLVQAIEDAGFYAS
jgi:copper chaperone CopZ